VLIVHYVPWWEKLPPGPTVVPRIGLSDQKELTNVAGDKQAWLVYLTIRHTLSRTRNRPIKMPILLLALLLVPPKFTPELAPADEAQRLMNPDVLRTVFDLVLGSLQQVVQEGTVIDCAEGKTHFFFPILYVGIADNAEHAALHRIGSKSCSRWEVPCKELCENFLNMHETHDYILYRGKLLWHEPSEVADIAKYFQHLVLKIGNNILARLNQVNPTKLHMPDLLHNI